MAKDKGQENQRYRDIFLDQHGREYLANCEKSTNDPVDLAVNGWDAPLEPAWARKLFLPPIDDVSVVKMVAQRERNRKRYQIQIDYRAWLTKIDERTAARADLIMTIAQDSFKGAELLKIMDGSSVPAELLRYVGHEPLPPREIILAMEAGNAWALGRSAKIPDLALALLERIRPAVEVMRSQRYTDAEVVDPFGEAEAEREELPVPTTPDPFEPGSEAEAELLATVASGGTMVKPPKRR